MAAKLVATAYMADGGLYFTREAAQKQKGYVHPIDVMCDDEGDPEVYKVSPELWHFFRHAQVATMMPKLDPSLRGDILSFPRCVFDVLFDILRGVDDE